MLKRTLTFLILLSSFILLLSEQTLYLKISENPGFERLVLQAETPFVYVMMPEKDHLSISISNGDFGFKEKIFGKELIKGVSWDKNTRELKIYYNKEDIKFVSFILNDPFRLVIDFSESLKKDIKKEEQPGIERKTQMEERQTPVKVSPQIIVIDPGHGGEEEGAVGPSGLKEKDVALSVAKKIKNIIEQRAGIKVFLTRDGDQGKSLDERISLANNLKADLFISIHVNASVRKNARGAETYFLSLNATDEDAKRLSQIENLGEDLGDNSDLKLILWDMAQSAFLKQSSLLAELIQSELNSLLRTKDRGVKQAPFKVLTGLICPAVLVEIGFITNSDEEKKLRSESFQENIAEAIYQGILRFMRQKERI
jgi:N-acetylmuramoyl-L-alanine amidase